MITNNTIINERAVDFAIQHALKCFPEESCGCVVGGEYIPLENTAEDKNNTFKINSVALERDILAGTVECLIHSHNDAPYASFADMKQQHETEVPYGIVNIKNGEATHFMVWGCGVPKQPLVGREFFFGIQDCWSLVCDYVKDNRGIELIDPPREWMFWTKGFPVFEKYLEEEHAMLEPLPPRTAEPGDIFFYKYGSDAVITHAGVFLGDKVLHHFAKRLSGAYPVDFCINRMFGVYRVKE